MRVENPSPNLGPSTAHQDMEITVGNVNHLLILNPEFLFPAPAHHSHNFLARVGFHATSHALALVYPVTPGEIISASALRDFRANTLGRDDVFQPAFATNLIFYGSDETDLVIEPDALAELKSWNVGRHYALASNPPTSSCTVARGPPGSRGEFTTISMPVSWSHSNPRPLTRRDDDGAAQVPITADRRLTLVAVDAPYAGVNGRVVVPSRCYYKPTKDRPLAGARISVKDNFDVAGHKTTLCNRAWIDLYPAKTKNAACIQTLVDAGAVIVGKVKLQAMIMREEPLECVEFTAPFNPRADGYQVPSGSSHASAAGIASYDWLDFSIGSDTNGSGRKPASYNGCFSIRPTTGVVDTDGVAAIYPFYHDQYHSLEGFRNDYARKYGRPAFVHRALHWQWEVGKAISKDERDECWRRSEVYRHWMLDKILKAGSQDTVVMMPLPIEAGQPNYRDAPPPPYSLLSGYAALHMSPMLGAPEVTAPVGDIPYMSTVTDREEALPVSVSLIGAPGTDLLLPRLVEM
ncbi:hypothetical protein LLEC1_06508, partial [Akanthomyces lecanii]